MTAGLTTTALACGIAKVEINGEFKVRPVIWMEHIHGVNLYEHSINVGMQYNPNFTRLEARAKGYEDDGFQRHLYRAVEVYNALKATGYSAWDAEMDHNYMLRDDGCVLAIDFRPEKMDGRLLEDRGLMRDIYRMHGDDLKITLPLQHMATLSKLGCI